MSFVIKDSFFLFLSVGILLYFFFCITPLVWAYNSILKRKGESGHPCLFQILYRIQSFMIKYEVSCRISFSFFFFLIAVLYHVRKVFLFLVCWEVFFFFFIMNDCWTLSDAFSVFIDIILCVFFFSQLESIFKCWTRFSFTS